MLTPSKHIQSGRRFRAYPDSALAERLRQWIGCQRVIYNAKVSEDKLFAVQRRLQLASGSLDVITPLDQQYAQFKDRELTPWLYDVPSQILRNGAVRWMAAKQRQLQGLAKAPVLRNRNTFNSVLVTSELFRFKAVCRSSKEAFDTVLELGTEKNPIGLLPFKAHRDYGLPKQIVLREVAVHWFVSFAYEHVTDRIIREPHELAYEFNNLPEDELRASIVGLDRNVKDNCLATSEGTQFRFDPVNIARMERKAQGAKRYQRRLARAQKGSNNRRKLKRKLAARQNYATRMRNDFSHKVSCTLANSSAQVFAVEALNIKGMVRSPKPRPDNAGRYMPNGSAAKAGLNKAVLASAWGLVAERLSYKAARKNKLMLSVPPVYSSQECSRCGHTHPDNRKEQRFVCQRCGFVEHADTNAACVIKKRAFDRIRSGALETAKIKKRVRFRKDTGGLPERVCGADVRPESPSTGGAWAVCAEAENLRCKARSTVL